jgi:apolipoprotein N-acyltransferase
LPRFTDLALKYPRLSALSLGVVSALGFEPLALWPLALLAVAGLLALLVAAPSRKGAFLLGWSFGFGQFSLGLNWIATAFGYQAAMPAWLGWGGVLGLSACLAIYPGLALLAAWHFRSRLTALVPAMAASWIVTEWLRGWVLTGFPWNPLGAVLLGPFDAVSAAQLLPWLGTFALSGLAALFAGLWYAGLSRFRADRRMLALLPLPILVQFWPHKVYTEAEFQRGVPYALVQPNIPQEQLNDPAFFEVNFQRLAQLLPPPYKGDAALVLWPESGVPDYLRDGYPAHYYLDTYAADPAQARSRLARFLGPERLLLSGTVDLEVRDGKAVGARNSITAIDGQGTIRASYAKAHLVPFGEYVPMRAVLEPLGLARFVPGSIEFWPGTGPRTIALGRFGKAGMGICYEIIFPGAVADRKNRPDYLFNPSNDGWYGSWGPPQHLAQARMRALEEGLPVLRSTTNGISAVIAADGRVVHSVPLGAAGVLLGKVPPAAPPTLFARHGNALSLGWALLLLVASLVALRLRRR